MFRPACDLKKIVSNGCFSKRGYGDSPERIDRELSVLMANAKALKSKTKQLERKLEFDHEDVAIVNRNLSQGKSGISMINADAGPAREARVLMNQAFNGNDIVERMKRQYAGDKRVNSILDKISKIYKYDVITRLDDWVINFHPSSAREQIADKKFEREIMRRYRSNSLWDAVDKWEAAGSPKFPGSEHYTTSYPRI